MLLPILVSFAASKLCSVKAVSPWRNSYSYASLCRSRCYRVFCCRSELVCASVYLCLYLINQYLSSSLVHCYPLLIAVDLIAWILTLPKYLLLKPLTISSSFLNYFSTSWTQHETVPFQNPSSFCLAGYASEPDPIRSGAINSCSSYELRLNCSSQCSIRLVTYG